MGLNPDQPMKYAHRDARRRARALLRARKAAGITQEILDEQYRRALEANGGNNVGGRAGGASHTSRV